MNTLQQTRYDKALVFAQKAHGRQLRKYTHAPYWTHCVAVADLVQQVPSHSIEMLETALLHDTVEDTIVRLDDIRQEFGDIVALGVDFLTDWESINDDPESQPRAKRAIRKRRYAERLALAPPWVQTVKLADLIDNTSTIVNYDPTFARLYLQEKRESLALLTLADPSMRERAEISLQQAERSLLTRPAA
jgi:(p)ppGpp synthase/HD superfamily hydrolase